MIESNLNSPERAKTVRFSGSEFQTVVEALHDAAGNGLPGPKPVEQKLSVGPQHARHLLHGFNPVIALSGDWCSAPLLRKPG